MKYLSFLTILIFFPLTIIAQGTIEADRPGFGVSSSITPVGSFGLETGLTYSEFYTSVGELYLRAGLTQRLEVQFEAGSIVFPDAGDSYRTANSAILKYNVYQDPEGKLRITLMNRLVLPFLNEDFSEYLNYLFLLGDFQIHDLMSINTNIGYGNFVFSDFDVPTYFFTLNPSIKIDESITGFLGFSYVELDSFGYKNYEIGFSYLISSDSQFDFGIVISEDSDLFVRTGFSVRI